MNVTDVSYFQTIFDAESQWNFQVVHYFNLATKNLAQSIWSSQTWQSSTW